ncbi:cell wall-binding repeat-containing protein [Rathayibacter oskolensis]|uniref:cell wall-binding repeat-containing protein n=1 Tax=Rathayibacter oskolensis TaxID=1891671 RepID=UPI00265ED1CD|nr:cell wall-binding repeat-containing protein [Rathayibacter oskolensis]WKK70691.1 cell wall-binding repeat-containing protein [Rathayibacter oskolensis]
MSLLSLRSAAAAVLVTVLALGAAPLAAAEPLPGAPLTAAADTITAPAQAIVPEGEEPWEPSATTPLPEVTAAPAARSAAGAAATASAAASISGTVRVEEADGSVASTMPSDASLSVEVWTPDGTSLGLWPVAADLTFTAGGLEAGRSYYLLLRDDISPSYASTWYGGSIVAVGAVPLQAPASGVEMTTSRVGSISGTIGGVSGDRRIDIWYRYPTTGSYFLMDSQDIRVYFGDPYTFPAVPAGDYLVRASTQYGSIDDTYWDHVRRSGEASDVPVAVGGAVSGIDLALDDQFLFYTGRLAGSDRYATSVAATSAVFSPGIPVLYLASGAKWPDALSAAPAAAAQGGALLLTDPDRLPPVVADEIRRLDPARSSSSAAT